jgi:hypothetical protein
MRRYPSCPGRTEKGVRFIFAIIAVLQDVLWRNGLLGMRQVRPSSASLNTEKI